MVEIEPASQKALGLSDSEYKTYVNGFLKGKLALIKELKKELKS